jgi:hypothetical protein
VSSSTSGVDVGGDFDHTQIQVDRSVPKIWMLMHREKIEIFNGSSTVYLFSAGTRGVEEFVKFLCVAVIVVFQRVSQGEILLFAPPDTLSLKE